MTKKILIVDDEPSFINPNIQLLALCGIKESDIIYCSQIDEAFTALQQEKGNIACMSLDLLIGDNMNVLKGDDKINGIKALKQIRELYPSLPIVCYSILEGEDGGIRETINQYNATFINKQESIFKLIDFFKKCYE